MAASTSTFTSTSEPVTPELVSDDEEEKSTNLSSDDDNDSTYDKIFKLFSTAHGDDGFFQEKLTLILDNCDDLSEAKDIINQAPNLLSMLGDTRRLMRDYPHYIQSQLINHFRIGFTDQEEYQKLVEHVHATHNTADFQSIMTGSLFPYPSSWQDMKSTLEDLNIRYKFSNEFIFKSILDFNADRDMDYDLTIEETLDLFNYATSLQANPLKITPLIYTYMTEEHKPPDNISHELPVHIINLNKPENHVLNYLIDRHPLALCQALGQAVFSYCPQRALHFFINLLEHLYDTRVNIASPAIPSSQFFDIQIALLENFFKKTEERKGPINEEKLISKHGAFVRWIASMEWNIPKDSKAYEQLLKARHDALLKINPSSPTYRLFNVSRNILILKAKQEIFCQPTTPLTPLQTFIFSSPAAWRTLLYFTSQHRRDYKNPLRKLPVSLLYLILSFHDPLYLLREKDMVHILFHIQKSRRDKFGFFQRVETLPPLPKKQLTGDSTFTA